MPKGESDGPPGAAGLARALYWGLGAVPVYVCEQRHVDPIVASSEAAHLMVKDFADAKEKRLGAVVAAAPNDPAAVDGWVKDLFDRIQPKALVAIERLGPNDHGVIYNATGQIKGPQTGILDLASVVHEAARRGVFTVGIGDHGNEIGFGRIEPHLKKVMPYGAKSQGRQSRRQCLRGEDRRPDPRHDVQLGRLRDRGGAGLSGKGPQGDAFAGNGA